MSKRDKFNINPWAEDESEYKSQELRFDNYTNYYSSEDTDEEYEVPEEEETE